MSKDFISIIYKTFYLPENKSECVEDSKDSRKALVNVLDTLDGREVTVDSTGLSFYNLLITILSIVSIYGLWKMRKWGALLFISLEAIHLLVLCFLAGEFFVPFDSKFDRLSILLTILFFPIVLPYWRKLA